MRRPLASAAALALTALIPLTCVTPVASAAPSTPAPTPPSTSTAAPTAAAPRFGHQGRWITDEQGRAVITMGVNQVAKVAPYTHESVGFGEDDAAFLQKQGFTSVRLGVIWKGVEPKPGTYDDAYLASIKRTVEILDRHGISTLLDSHQDMLNEQFQGEGAPDWAIQTGGAPNVIKAGFPANEFLNTATMNAFQAFFDNKPGPDGVGLADHFAKAWAHTAAYFKDTAGIMGFDVFNEPFPGNVWVGCLLPAGCPVQDKRISAVQQKAVDAIREVDEDTTIYYEPMQFFNVGVPTYTKVTGKNLGFSFHDYCTGQTLFKKYVGCKSSDAQVFANAEKQSQRDDQALLLTEFGAITAPDVITAQTDLAMKNRVGYQWWAYTGGDPTTAGPGATQALVLDAKKAPEGDNVDWKKLGLVAVPMPHRVAGTPTNYAYDRATRTFTFTYTPTKVGGGTFGAGSTTTVTIPQVAAPKGYTVSVDGAKVTSAPDADVLTLALAPGASSVKVTVRAS